jgi:alkylation response protein AidB-like acyl-CoA dehydrogenase
METMTQIDRGWGADPSQRYDELASRFRPLFQRIRAGAVDRELARRLPLEEIKQLKQSGFGALRVPAADGGADASLPELFNLLIELSEADSNLTQGLRGHFGFAEDVVNSTDQARRDLWFPRLVRGDIVGNAWSEVGEAGSTAFSARVTRHGETLRLNGEKYYTTGSFYADWIDVGSTDEEGEGIGATVARDAPGVQVVDDWDGFGQIRKRNRDVSRRGG